MPNATVNPERAALNLFLEGFENLKPTILFTCPCYFLFDFVFNNNTITQVHDPFTHIGNIRLVRNDNYCFALVVDILK